MILPLPLRSIMVASVALGLAAGQPASARSGEFSASSRSELPAYLQCVPYAREVSGIRIFGDAHTWWEQAASRYQRGNQPKVGAVMAFKPNGKMRLGHVAAVSQIIDSRTVLLDHANWSPINGRRGQIERNVRAIDVSRANDWSQVRVWYHPLQALGKTAWPVHGFIYGKGKVNRAPFRQESRPAAPVRIAVSKDPSKAFLSAFSGLGPAKATRPAPARQNVSQRNSYRKAPPLPPRATATASRARDPFAAVLSKYD
ncbi:CHAP domain-containing protein [Parerythrobacter jejuensis]|uniref:CHAP domain-containing protein n=1 Tax=Parerythrobacter jejuensis TaxID=795812 RepID=A0A845APH3_9SPHN|nr:CHAP domain-containing protein [Parerythrobacter jejuensis]MXP31514.1 CHAP domain-containing protein [Parerythrobacter jejuensis]